MLLPARYPLPAAELRFGGILKLLRFTAFAFLGGVILNLMPCVFPVLFIKGLALVEASRHHYTRVRAHGLVYAMGILVSFWAVVALLLGLKAGGRQLGWGFQFQSPGFVAVIALLLFFLGLSLAGMFEIGLTVTSAGSSLASRHGYAGSFFTGVLAVVVATPCTAPFMGAAIGFALAQSAAVAFAVFTALGLGLAAPYLLLTFHPVWMRHLPRPGAWMEVLKQATSVPIFGTVIWLVWLFASSAGVDALTALTGGFSAAGNRRLDSRPLAGATGGLGLRHLCRCPGSGNAALCVVEVSPGRRGHCPCRQRSRWLGALQPRGHRAIPGPGPSRVCRFYRPLVPELPGQ